MKKILLSGVVVMLAACTSNYEGCGCNQENLTQGMYQNEMSAPVVQNYIPIVFDSCNCAYKPDANRELIRPRIKIVKVEEVKRNCPNDSQVLNCGCGECNTFSQDENKKEVVSEVIPAMPQAYELAASRIFNNIIRDTVNVYGEKPNVLLYLMPTEVVDEDLPEGANQGLTLLKNKILSSFTYALTDDENNNDYVLKTTATWFDTPSKVVPAIKYEATLYNKDGDVIGQWVEIVKKAENSQKWL